MSPSNLLFAALILFILLLLGFWGGRRFLFRRRRPEHDAVLTQDEAEKSDVVDDSQILRTYFRGLSYVIANETDKAVAEFVKVAKVNTTTAEIYLALGQLFRNTGELERAIRVHRDILLRPNLPDDIRQQTFFEIGLDYKKAGFFDRACCTFEEIVEKNPKDHAARRELSALYVGMREWEKALVLSRDSPTAENETNVIAHLTTEVAKAADQAGDKKKAQTFFRKAIDLNKNCVDAWLHYGDFLINENLIQEALDAWEKAFLINPEFTSQIIDRFAKLPALERDGAVDEFFNRHLDNYSQSKEFNLTYINWQIKSGRLQEARLRLCQLLAQGRGDKKIFSLVRQLIQSPESVTGSECENQDLIQALLMADFRFEKNYHCQKCGYRLDQMVWRCPRCFTWDSVTLR